MIILDGKKTRDEIKHRLKEEVAHMIRSGYVTPRLAIVQIGNNHESALYIENKKKFGQAIGVEVTHIHVPQAITEEELLREIQALNQDDSIHGIIVQMPLPKHIHPDVCIEAIDSKKDVDGLHSANVKALWTNHGEGIMPATTRGILTLLKKYETLLEGKQVVVVGRSSLVGKPTAIALLNRNATVTVCHSKTPNLEFHTAPADIIIAAAGVPRLISEQHVRPGQLIIDVGITIEEVPEKKAVGDVDFENVKNIVHAISPVPGGVRPMTVASLFENLVDAYMKRVYKK